MFLSPSYFLLVALEVVAIGGGSGLLGAAGHREYVIAWVATVVGIHFLAFGRLFWAGFYWLGTALIAAGIAGATVGFAGGGLDGIKATSGLIAAASLFVAGSIVIGTSRRPRVESIMRRGPLSVLAVLATLVAVPTADAAVTVSPTKIRFPQVAINSTGRTVVAWERWTGHRFAVEARVGARSFRLKRIQQIGKKGESPLVAIGVGGNAAVAWSAEAAPVGVREIRAAVARRGHGFGRSRLVARRRAYVALVGVAVQPVGRVVVVWMHNRKVLTFAVARPGHGFSEPRAIGPAVLGSGISLVTDPRDGAVVLSYGAAKGAVATTLAVGAASFTPPVVVSRIDPDPAKQGAANPRAIVGPAGAGVAYALTFDGPRTLEVALRAADGSWMAPRRIAVVEAADDQFTSGVTATLPADGGILAAWSVDTYPPNGLGGPLSKQVFTSVAPASHPVGPPLALTRPNRRTSAPSVASSGSNAFVAVASAGRIRVAKRVRGGTAVQPPRTLLRSGADGDVFLAAGGRHVLAAFQQGDRLRLAAIG
jgi:hypothetical protein